MFIQPLGWSHGTPLKLRSYTASRGAVTREFKNLGDGQQAFEAALNVTETPFPFPHDQMAVLAGRRQCDCGTHEVATSRPNEIPLGYLHAKVNQALQATIKAPWPHSGFVSFSALAGTPTLLPLSPWRHKGATSRSPLPTTSLSKRSRRGGSVSSESPESAE